MNLEGYKAPVRRDADIDGFVRVIDDVGSYVLNWDNEILQHPERFDKDTFEKWVPMNPRSFANMRDVADSTEDDEDNKVIAKDTDESIDNRTLAVKLVEGDEVPE